MMVQVPLVERGSVILDANGAGTVKLGIASARETWLPDHVAVRVNTAIREAQCRIYVGPDVGDQYFRGRTITGSTGDTARLGDTIRGGIYIWAAWEGGDPGVAAILTVTGIKELA